MTLNKLEFHGESTVDKGEIGFRAITVPFQNQFSSTTSISSPIAETSIQPPFRLSINERLIGRAEDSLVVLEDDIALLIFESVGQNRSMVLKDLLEQKELSVLERDTVLDRINRLVDEGLIERQPAPISDFDIYYATAEGLAAKRLLQQTRTTLTT